MIKNFNNKKNRVCLGLVLSVCLLAHGKSSASGSSELDDATRNRNNIAGGQGTMSGNNITGTVEQNYNKGGEGGKAEVHNHIGYAHSQPLSKTPDDYFEEGRNYLDEVPPNYNRASVCFLRAVGAAEQHLKIEAYIQLAVCKRGQNNLSEALSYYENALKFGSNDTALRGLMELHFKFSQEADDDTEYLLEELHKAQIAGNQIGHKDKEVRLKLKKIRETLAEVDSQKKDVVERPSSVTSLSDLTISPSSDNKKANRILEAKAEAERIIAEAEEEAEYNRTISEAKIKAEEIKTKAKTKTIFDDKVSSDTKTITRSYPVIARGYEAIYDRFMNGRLVYKGPAGERSFLISDIANSSLEGEFNLKGLTFTSGSTTYNISDYLRIKLGYRKVKENEDKTTAWIVPQFVSRAGDSSFNAVRWRSDVGIFWTWGEYDLTDFDYLTSMQFDEISTKNLYDLAAAARRASRGGAEPRSPGWAPVAGRVFSFIFN